MISVKTFYTNIEWYNVKMPYGKFEIIATYLKYLDITVKV